MKLPSLEGAIVPRSKISDYLLSTSHPGGRGEAKWFMGYGFVAERWEELAEALKQHAAENEVSRTEESGHGKRYTVEGALETLDGRRILLRSVWFIEAGEDVARFVTAYPLLDSHKFSLADSWSEAGICLQ